MKEGVSSWAAPYIEEEPIDAEYTEDGIDPAALRIARGIKRTTYWADTIFDGFYVVFFGGVAALLALVAGAIVLSGAHRWPISATCAFAAWIFFRFSRNYKRSINQRPRPD